MRDERLHRDEQAALADRDEARQALGHLHAPKRSSPDSGSRASTASDSESCEMNGNGWPGPTPSGVSTGKTSRSKRRSISRSSFSEQSSTACDADALVGERRAELALQELRLPLRQVGDPRADRGERLARRQAVGRAHDEAGRGLVEQAATRTDEELVEVLGEDRAELHPLEERDVRVLGEREHAGVELEPGELAVEELARRGGGDRGGTSRPSSRISALPGGDQREGRPPAVRSARGRGGLGGLSATRDIEERGDRGPRRRRRRRTRA